ncbi:hypothetical protein FIBSPDRAFT_876597, partial [Athelia psychrophila]
LSSASMSSVETDYVILNRQDGLPSPSRLWSSSDTVGLVIICSGRFVLALLLFSFAES